MISTYEKTNNIKLNFEITKRREGDVAVSTANGEKSELELGFKATKNLADMCRDSYNFATKKKWNIIQNYQFFNLYYQQFVYN